MRTIIEAIIVVLIVGFAIKFIPLLLAFLGLAVADIILNFIYALLVIVGIVYILRRLQGIL